MAEEVKGKKIGRLEGMDKRHQEVEGEGRENNVKVGARTKKGPKRRGWRRKRRQQ